MIIAYMQLWLVDSRNIICAMLQHNCWMVTTVLNMQGCCRDECKPSQSSVPGLYRFWDALRSISAALLSLITIRILRDMVG